MKKIFIISLILMNILLTSCAVVQQLGFNQERLKKLTDELDRWQSFRLTGEFEGDFGLVTGKFPCVITKSPDRFRIDLKSAGIMGIGAGREIFAGYIDSNQVQYRLPVSSRVETKALGKETSFLSTIVSAYFAKSIYDQRMKIIETLQCEIGNMRIKFSPDMRFDEIVVASDNMTVHFDYNQMGVLVELRASVPLFRNLKLNIEQIEIGNVVAQGLH